MCFGAVVPERGPPGGEVTFLSFNVRFSTFNTRKFNNLEYMSHTAGRSTLHFVWRIVSPLEFIIEHQPRWSAQDFYFVYLAVVELKKVQMNFCPGCVFFCRAGADGRVFVLRGCSQNVPPLMAANGRCACLCINQGAVNLPFNR